MPFAHAISSNASPRGRGTSVLTWTTGDRLLVTICAGCFLMRLPRRKVIATASCPNSSSNPRGVGISAASNLLGLNNSVRRCSDATRTWRIYGIRSAPGKPQRGPHTQPLAQLRSSATPRDTAYCDGDSLTLADQHHPPRAAGDVGIEQAATRAFPQITNAIKFLNCSFECVEKSHARGPALRPRLRRRVSEAIVSARCSWATRTFPWLT
jgi:hypothetical protein